MSLRHLITLPPPRTPPTPAPVPMRNANPIPELKEEIKRLSKENAALAIAVEKGFYRYEKRLEDVTIKEKPDERILVFRCYYCKYFNPDFIRADKLEEWLSPIVCNLLPSNSPHQGLHKHCSHYMPKEGE